MDLPAVEPARRVGLTVDAVSQALASDVRSILSGDAPYYRFVNGDRTVLSAEQQAGLQLVRGRGNCTACHPELRPLRLTRDEKRQLVAFLRPLAGTIVERDPTLVRRDDVGPM